MDRQAQSPAHKLARRGNKGEDEMEKAKRYLLAFQITTDECPAELMASLRHYAERLADDLTTEGFTADLLLDSERVEDARYDGAEAPRCLWSGW
jgi:hypothetical protein